MTEHKPLVGVMKPVNQANGLPNAHYIDPHLFQEEKRAVLFANWSGIGFAKDIPEAGDARPVNFAGMPLLMVRDRDGSVKVFQNVCRHRGMTLVDKPTRIRGAIRCPYHSWCYGLNGELRTTPHVGGPGQNSHEDINPAELGLIRIRSHVWMDVVFVNIDGAAPGFHEVHAELLERWKEFDQPIYHGGEGSSLKLDVAANWKLAVENYCESYHLPWVHPDLNSYSRLEDHYDICLPNKYSGQGSYVYEQLEDAEGRRLPDFANLSEKWDTGAEYVALYPNVLLGVQRDHCFAMVLEPLGCERTIEHLELYYAVPPDCGPEMQALLQAIRQRWKTVFEEDIFVVEGLQKGRHAELFDGGRFSPAMDEPTHNFHYWVAGQIEKARAA